MSDARAPDLTPQQRAELEVELLREHVHDHAAMQFITAAFDEVRASHPHLPPRDVLHASRDAWFAVRYGFMSARRARRGIPGHALRVAALFPAQAEPSPPSGATS